MATFIPYLFVLSVLTSPSPQLSDNLDRAQDRIKAAQSWAKETIPEKELKLVRIYGDGEIGKDTGIIIHGICDTYQSVAKLGQAYGKKLSLRNVYSLSYDWSDTSKKAALYIAKQLSKIDYEECNKSMIIIGHSRGVLVVRYLIEVLRFSIPFKKAFLICGPNEGSKKDWIVKNAWMFSLAMPVVDELKADGKFLNTLNTQVADRALIDYTLVAASEDDIVSTDSALAKNVRLQQKVMGLVQRVVFDGAHGDVKTSDYQIRQVLAVSLKQDDPLDYITLELPEKSVDLVVDDYWSFPTIIKNMSKENVVIDDVSVDRYDRLGKWCSTCWLPIGTSTPKKVTPLVYNRSDFSLPSLYLLDTTTFVYLDENIRETDKLYQATTVIITVSYHDKTGKTGRVSGVVVCHNGSVWPILTETSHKDPSWHPKASICFR